MTAASLPRSSATPADLSITPRDRRFGRDEATPRWWHGGNPYASALYNALSATFPEGEAFFVESVRAHRHGVEPRLAGEIKAFTTQEVIHSREHLAFNRRAADAGYDLSKLEARVHERLELTKSRPPIASLAATMALEHFTAILAHELLADPRHLSGADPATAELWRWHAAEEIEHKGVAYDTWLHATQHWPRRKRWTVKAKVMMLVTRNFIVDRTAGALELLRQDGITGPRAVAGLLWYAWIAPGMFRKVFAAWASFFMPRFHPWNEDDRALIANYERSGQFIAAEPDRKVRSAA
jgi:predicted metal-dependent hydrolase